METISKETRIIDLTIEQLMNFIESQREPVRESKPESFRMNRKQVAEKFGISLPHLTNLQHRKVVHPYYEENLTRPYFLSDEVQKDFARYENLRREKKKKK